MGITILIIGLSLHLLSGFKPSTPQILGTQIESPEHKHLPTELPVSPISEIESITTPLVFKNDEIIIHKLKKKTISEAQNSNSDDIFTAVNNYRTANGRNLLSKDEKICALTQRRAEEQEKLGTLDNHQGFNAYMADPNNWKTLGVHGISENSAWNHPVSARELIEEVFAKSPPHQENQLKSEWIIGCAAVSGKTVDIIFAKR